MRDLLLETDTRFHPGDVVTIRKDLVVGKQYYMDDGTTRDTFVPSMRWFLGKKCEITDVTDRWKYRIKGSNENWTDRMFEEPRPEDMPDPEDIGLLYDFM